MPLSGQNQKQHKGIYMKSNVVDHINSCGSIDPLVKRIDTIIAVTANYRDRPIRGRLINITPEYIELERLSGEITTIRRRCILVVEDARDARMVA